MALVVVQRVSLWPVCGIAGMLSVRGPARGRIEEAGMREGLELWVLVGTNEVA
jgi:hypothetical protein